MSQQEETSEIFSQELSEIRQRRENLGLDFAGLETSSPQPSVDLGIVGLSISGGGIRSAIFSLGIIQGLAHHGVLKRIDYLSTVSGGGFTGSCLSSVLNDESHSCDQSDPDKRFPLGLREGTSEPPAITHLRNSSNYLVPGGLLDQLRLPALMLRGVFLNLFLFLPFIAGAVFVTEIIYETSHSRLHLPTVALGLLTFFLLSALLLAFATRVFRSWLDWQRRDALEKLIGVPLLIAVALIAAIPMTWLVQWSIEQSLSQALEHLRIIREDYGLAIVLVGLFIGGLFTLAGKASKNVSRLTSKAVLLVVGLIGPLVIVGMYLFLCLWQIDSPYLSSERFKDQLETAQKCGKQLKYCLPDEHNNDNLIYALNGRLVDTGVREFPIQKYTVEGPCEGSEGWSLRSGDDPDRKICIIPHPDNAATLLIGKRASGIFRIFDGFRDVYLLVAAMLLFFFNRYILDVNISSPHGFYRDRLSKAFLFNVDRNGAIVPNDRQKLSQLNQPGSTAPYHLINATLNLPADSDPSLRGRKAGFFVFSKHFVGGEQSGYCKTTEIEKYDHHLDLGTAMAISGAAASPNMGSTTIKPLVFILTLLNIRLGYWLPNPDRVKRDYWMKSITLKSARPFYVLKEAIGLVDAKGSRINVTDGAHIENLGLYALLQRRCKFIVAIDGEADSTMSFEGLIKVMRLARIDLGVEFDMDLSPFGKHDGVHSKQQWVLGKITYSDGKVGEILYLKLSLTGEEPIYLESYRQQNTDYPHQSTADQFFDEEQFEAYRALGQHIADQVVTEPGPVADFLARMKSASADVNVGHAQVESA